jgi:hypothetical protein
MNTTIGRLYSTPHSNNAWAWLTSGGGWRKIKPIATDGVTNTFVALAAARQSGITASVSVDGANEIVAVYV